MSEPFSINSHADLSRLIGWCTQHAPHRVPLLEAVYHKVVALAEVTREGTAPVKQLDRTGLPAIILIGDDDGFDSGPARWASARRLAYWARYAFVHATGGDVPSYRAAVMIATAERRLVLVETGTTHIMAWHRHFCNAGVASLNLIPPNGGVHPVEMPRESLH